VQVSFDCNFRAKLWQAWDSNPASILRSCAGLANVLFADARSLSLILGHTDAGNTPAEAFAALSEIALQTFPTLEYIACTHRVEHTVSHHQLGARLRSRKQLTELAQIEINPIVDRIGAGDAFAAGLLHALIDKQDERDALKFALSASCIKHSIHGDFNLASREQIEQLRDSDKLAVQR
jgi:2-dehydro-3-deoxygluconokinase